MSCKKSKLEGIKLEDAINYVDGVNSQTPTKIKNSWRCPVCYEPTDHNGQNNFCSKCCIQFQICGDDHGECDGKSFMTFLGACNDDDINGLVSWYKRNMKIEDKDNTEDKDNIYDQWHILYVDRMFEKIFALTPTPSMPKLPPGIFTMSYPLNYKRHLPEIMIRANIFLPKVLEQIIIDYLVIQWPFRILCDKRKNKCKSKSGNFNFGVSGWICNKCNFYLSPCGESSSLKCSSDYGRFSSSTCRSSSSSSPRCSSNSNRHNSISHNSSIRNSTRRHSSYRSSSYRCSSPSVSPVSRCSNSFNSSNGCDNYSSRSYNSHYSNPKSDNESSSSKCIIA